MTSGAFCIEVCFSKDFQSQCKSIHIWFQQAHNYVNYLPRVVAPSIDCHLICFRSGEEGYYPDLLAACEKKLQSLAPKSRVLRKEEPVATPADLPKDEWSQIDSDLKVG